MKVSYKKNNRVSFKPTHAIYPSNTTYDSWTTLCEHTIDLAMEYIDEHYDEVVDKLAQEMLATAEECPCP